ncbi:hypothetical protein G6O69_31580 [Pseudenhygromyxa sp. WMMC2535]|uniref:FxLYD domain-containing protein n=1 Tax=Pseudenhygromyxa sp. WMMC2535 TaxID=2712867 RepID=UPI001553D26E|nr:FxLYD domain-containing protein [Pseudenhygromyxa sp. WMMC2535]NVB42407.1 hypothetical protein [Pseudenhygromyxa sp. WMMC2535]
MKNPSPRRVALLLGLSFGLSGCSFIFDAVNKSKAKKADEEAQQAQEAELAEARAALAKQREAALDPASTPQQLWEYGVALAEARQDESMQVDPAWTPELEAALSQRLEAAGGINAENTYVGFALAKVYSDLERPDESVAVMLELVKAGGEGPISQLELFDAAAALPRSETTDAAVLEMCPLLRPQVESVSAFVSRCLGRAGGDISKLTWEGALDDLEVYARSSYASGPPAGTYTFQSRIKGYKKTFWAVGYVENTSGVYLTDPKVTAVLLDDGGAEVGTFSGYSMIDQVAPGVRAPVTILISDPPAHASIRYEYEAERAEYLTEQVKGLRVEALTPKRKRYGWKIEGKVISEAEVPAKFVKVVIQAFDAEGTLLGAQAAYADGDTLSPGGSARWQTLSMEIASKPDHFEYWVSGRVAND